MSNFTIQLSANSKKTVLKSTSSAFFSYVLMVIFMFATTSKMVANENENVKNTFSLNDCTNPLASTLGYNAFVLNNTQLGGGDTEGPIAMGGNLTMNDIITIAAQTAGTNYFNGDSEAASLVVNGQVVYNSGQGIHLNQGFVKVGNLSGSSVYDTDNNNASVNTRVTAGSYDAMPRIQVQRKQPGSSVGHANLIDFAAVFAALDAKSLQYSLLSANLSVTSDNKITLAQNEINVLNLTASELLALPYLTFENKPNVNTPLIINVNASGDFDWNVFNMAGIGDQEGRFILWNFYNASTITLKGGGTLVGTLFAPKSDVVKDSSGNINGQVIASNYQHKQGELHQHVFEPCIDMGECALTVDAGDDVEFCGEGEVTLTASVEGQSECEECIGEYEIENTYRCGKDFYYVLWLKDDGNNIVKRFSNIDLKWTELANGTATLKGTVVDNNDAQNILEVDVVYTGRTTTTPANSPKDHFCHTEDANGWIYYTEVSGTIQKPDGSWSFDISRMGPAFQLGNGANVTETEVGKYGASGWFNTTDSNFNRGDFNINLGDCITTTTNEVNYLWSTGETTSSITVTEGGTYTVTVKDCENCEASDEVKVTIGSLDVDAGGDHEICEGEEITLTATVSGSSDCIDCTEEFKIENTDLCNKTDENFVLCLVDNGELRFFSNVNLIWQENQDGTATLKGTVYDHTITNENYDLEVNFSGKTTSGTAGGHLCNQENSTGWEYYPEFSGSLKQQNGSWSLDLSRNGRPFQLGNGANAGEREQGKYGASAGFGTTDSQYTRGDLNLNIGDCIASTTSSGISYLWSTGETTPTITVSPTEDTTYTVTVTDDCSNCEATDAVSVVVKEGLTVDLGEDQSICEGQEVVLTAQVEGAEDCEDCTEYGITDTEMCTGNGRKYALWLNNPTTNEGRFFANVDLVWKKANDGTATLKGKVYSDVLNQNYVVDVVFTGETQVPPSTGSPKEHFCYDEDATSWVYYPEYTGTITSEDGSWSTTISRTGPAFQVGNGANTNEMVAGRNGASGWFNTTNSDFTFGDFNINFGDCISGESNEIQYLWSTGETTQSITVSPDVDTTYTVTVSGCNDCGETTDEVLVSVSGGIELDLGEDQTICLGRFVTLTSPIEADAYLWSTGETTPSITVQVFSTETYTLEVIKDGCTGSDDVLITLGFCEGGFGFTAYPTVLEPTGKLSLSTTSGGNQEIRVSLHDLSGSRIGPVIVKNMSEGKAAIEIEMSQFSKLSSGLYLLKIQDGETTITKRIVIK